MCLRFYAVYGSQSWSLGISSFYEVIDNIATYITFLFNPAQFLEKISEMP